MKKMFFTGVISIFILIFTGCSADADIKTSKKGEGPISAMVTIYENDGTTLVAQNSSDSGGKLTVNLDYGKYKVKSSASGYQDAWGNLKIDLMGAMFGVDINMPMVAEETSEKTVFDIIE